MLDRFCPADCGEAREVRSAVISEALDAVAGAVEEVACNIDTFDRDELGRAAVELLKGERPELKRPVGEGPPSEEVVTVSVAIWDTSAEVEGESHVEEKVDVLVDELLLVVLLVVCVVFTPERVSLLYTAANAKLIMYVSSRNDCESVIVDPQDETGDGLKPDVRRSEGS